MIKPAVGIASAARNRLVRCRAGAVDLVERSREKAAELRHGLDLVDHAAGAKDLHGTELLSEIVEVDLDDALRGDWPALIIVMDGNEQRGRVGPDIRPGIIVDGLEALEVE